MPTDVEERTGGAVLHSFGEAGADEGEVVRWEPRRRVVFESGSSAGFLAAEGDGDQVAVSAYFYFRGARAGDDAAAREEAWADRAF